jgi:hypothetical protein
MVKNREIRQFNRMRPGVELSRAQRGIFLEEIRDASQKRE